MVARSILILTYNEAHSLVIQLARPNMYVKDPLKLNGELNTQPGLGW